jgi:hypothetical protein
VQILLASVTFMFTVAGTMVLGIAAGYATISGLLALFGRNTSTPHSAATPATVQGD